MTATFRAPKRSPFLQVAKSAIATVAAWLLAEWLISGPPPVFAAIAALLVVQPSLNQSFGKAIERSVGVVTGVIVASLLGLALGNGTIVVLVAVVAALLLSWLLRMTAGTSNQVAISAVLVLALGTATPNYAVDRVLETLLGALIGFIVNIAIVPPLSLSPAHHAVNRLSDALATSLDGLADACEHPRSGGELDALLERARAMRDLRGASETAIAAAAESLTLNPRARRHLGELTALTRTLDRFSPIVTQVIGMTRALRDRYEPSLDREPTMTAISEQLRRAAHDVRLEGQRAEASIGFVDSGDTVDVPALTTPLSVAAPSSGHWILVGSLLIDLLRIHDALAEAE